MLTPLVIMMISVKSVGSDLTSDRPGPRFDAGARVRCRQLSPLARDNNGTRVYLCTPDQSQTWLE